PSIHAFDDDLLAGRPEVQAASRLLMAALVRDFWVIEERHSVFDVKIERALSGKPGVRSRVVYLPRVRYVSSGMNVGRLSQGLESTARESHYVRSFFRKVDTPSPLQLEIANRQNIQVPPGHTYVRAHYRGGGEAQTIYRSRSALNLLYDIAAGA